MKVKHLGQICVGPSLTADEIRQVRVVLEKDTSIGRRITIHKLLAGETRYKILKLLHDLKELCVCDIAEILNKTVSAVSHQLKLLRQADLVETRRKGQTIYYSVKNKEVTRFL